MAGNSGGTKKSVGEFEAGQVHDQLKGEAMQERQTGNAGGMTSNVGGGRGQGIAHRNKDNSAKSGTQNRGGPT
ncbi:MAG: hypothetical protein ACK4N5_09690 [Myxococcales bacterium]